MVLLPSLARASAPRADHAPRVPVDDALVPSSAPL